MISVNVHLPNRQSRDDLVSLVTDAVVRMKRLSADEASTVPGYCESIREVESFGVRATEGTLTITINPRRLQEDRGLEQFLSSLISRLAP